MKTPIVMAAFGTTTKALDTYSYINERVAKRFSGHEILWAYSSRMVKDFIKKKKSIDLKHPHQVLAGLSEKGCRWAAVQSMHLMCGHEFYRLVDEINSCSMRASAGLPLLSSHGDYLAAAEALEGVLADREEEAVVLVGHGTDHPGWSTYVAFSSILRDRWGDGIFVGVVEGYPEMEETVKKVKKAGYEKVRLVPFMLVAGVHFVEDLAGEEDSWKSAFEEEGIEVSLEAKGLGYNDGIIDLFCNHIQEALDVIPVSFN